MTNDPILRLLGLAKKAGRLEIGEEPVGSACRARKARLVLLAGDAAPNTCRRGARFAQAGGDVPCLDLPFDKGELGAILGRTSCAMLALTDAGFAASVAEKLAAAQPDRYGIAAGQLRTSAQRVLQRQKEQRRHERKAQKRKPWVPPPPTQAKQVPSVRGGPKAAPDMIQAQAERRPKSSLGRPPRPKTTTSGGSGRRPTGKLRRS